MSELDMDVLAGIGRVILSRDKSSVAGEEFRKSADVPSVGKIIVELKQKTAQLVGRIKNEAPYVPGVGYVFDHEKKGVILEGDKSLSEESFEALSKEVYYLAKDLRKIYEADFKSPVAPVCAQAICEAIHELAPYCMDLAERIAWRDVRSDLRNITDQQIGEDMVAAYERKLNEVQLLIESGSNPMVRGHYKSWDFSGGGSRQVTLDAEVPALVVLLHDIGNEVSDANRKGLPQKVKEDLLDLQKRAEEAAFRTYRKETVSLLFDQIDTDNHAFWNPSACNKFFMGSNTTLMQERVHFYYMLRRNSAILTRDEALLERISEIVQNLAHN